jgi:hypothetical protein
VKHFAFNDVNSGQYRGGLLLKDLSMIWEYRAKLVPNNYTSKKFEELLNNAGDDSWELVTVIVSPDDERLAIFKRQKESGYRNEY